ncbi:sugar phosphate isomerase/epimerase family protein [Paenibacillus koleovorans]|uniref:sugar phosphate isomerase/epimerase family protein n=1 Tax=Paenibacillus koleovorans TaxID=121608 RepID=UPI000FDB8893|nr:sugar phosphate isomerase/epimerase family protein [Paenibacillus koleovorans]
MKLAYTTLGCPEWTWERIVEETVRMGYNGIEIRGLQGEMFVPKMTPFLEENLAQTMADLQARGLSICCFDTSCRFDDEEKFDGFVEEGKATIDLAARMGVPYIRVFGDRIPDPAKREEMIAQVARGMQALSQHAEGKPVMVLMETHGDFASSENLLAVAAQVESDRFGVLWDVANPVKYQDTGESVSQTYTNLSKLVQHTHIKDTLGTGSNEKITLVGEGDVPIPECIDILQQNGYDGWLSFEWEKKWHPTIEEPEVALPHFVEYMRGLAK